MMAMAPPLQVSSFPLAPTFGRPLGAPAPRGPSLSTWAGVAVSPRSPPMALRTLPNAVAAAPVLQTLPGAIAAPAAGLARVATAPQLPSERPVVYGLHDPVINKQMINKINELLQNEGSLRAICNNCFDRSTPTGRLDVNGLTRFKAMMEQSYGVPPTAANNFQDALERFDFDGNGSLDKLETFRLTKAYLLEFRRLRGGDPELLIPCQTPSEAGYTIARELAKGTQGVASLGTGPHGEQVVIKTYTKKKATAVFMEEFKQEMESMHRLDGHPNIAKCLDIFQDSQNLYMITLPNLGGDLRDLRSGAQRQGVAMTETWWKGIFKQCFEALGYMHVHALMHCDIKEANIMCRTENFSAPEVVLIDLGLVSAMANQEGGLMGTLGYMPPETWATGKWFPRGDIFSMGVVMLQLLSDRVPNADTGRKAMFVEGCRNAREICEATRTRPAPLHLMQVQSAGVRQLVDGCLQKVKNSRPTAPQALALPWLASVR
eukprot:TRINITY_DN20364_c0_g1_i1.p1 TRINITY_DN20364_c0_g1~~TRINITY_DN20364_c0_g1_i1.p1  ORF type:complete len:489 (+),score=85.62 TRINITY_DN20364_c0_g1_i1:80-1546(+)